MNNRDRKINLLRLVVAGLVIVIAILWLSNLKQVLKEDKGKNISESLPNWGELSKNISEIANKTGLSLDKENNKLKTVKVERTDSNKLINDMLNAVEEVSSEEQKNAQADNNCPEWINCMPNIDSKAVPCQIPRGCDGITKIAY